MRNFLLKIILKINKTDIYNDYYYSLKVIGLDNSEKKDVQEKLLIDMLIHCNENIPYYKQQFRKQGITINKDFSIESFTRISVLTKDIIRENYDILQLKKETLNQRGAFENTSGGSTGEPVKFIQDKHYWSKSMATKWLFYNFLDKNFPSYHLKLWGSQEEVIKGNISLKAKLKNWLYNRSFLNTFVMTEEKIEKYIGEINLKKPSIIEGYVQSIYELSLYIIKHKKKVYKPKGGIITSAGTLYPHMKKTIIEAFGCKVINRYGTREVGDIACSRNGNEDLEVDITQNYVEILNEEMKPVSIGETGKIYVTNLNNFSMPLIRYEIGDIGVRSEKDFQIKRIEGREMSVFKTRSGTIIPGEFFIHFIGVVHNNGSISKIQVIQEDYEKIVIKTIVKDEKKFQSDKQAIISSIKSVMGIECKVIFDIVEEIKPLKSGKFLYTLSKIT